MDASDAAAAILAREESIARRATEIVGGRRPWPEGEAGERARAFCVEDSLYHVRNLATAVDFEAPQAFSRYVRWCAEVLSARGVEVADLRASLSAVELALSEQVVDEAVIERARAALRAGASELA